MARKRTKAAKQAQTLLIWLESLNLPTRVINALRRDLEAITGEREGEEGSGALDGLDQARFSEELYRPRGGQVGKVPTIAKGAIDVLRAAIPAPVSDDSTEAVQVVQSDEEPAGGAQERAEVAQPAQDDEVSAAPSNDAQESAEVAQEAVPEATAPEAADVALASPDALEESPAGDVPVANAERLADVVPEAGTEFIEAPAPPKRRGRPPRTATATVDGTATAEASATPRTRRGRRPRGEGASVAPRMVDRAALTMPSSEALAPAPAAPATLAAADASFDVLLRLWRELHPQGRRAAMQYMAALLVEV